MRCLVVHESMWGNSRAVAEAIGSAIGSAVDGDVTTVDVADAPCNLEGVDLLVVGGPTHAFSMSRPSTRSDAVTKGAPAGRTERGIRDWLEELPLRRPGPSVATFDTRVGSMRHLPGSAARSAARLVRRRRLGRLVAVESFYVDDMAGPLLDGELARAREWARGLP